MFTDSHCHLNYSPLADDVGATLTAMHAAHVHRALTISCTMEEFPTVHALACAHPELWASVGVHPDSEDCHEPDCEELTTAAQLPRVIAVGETGLDYYDMAGRKGGRTIADMQWQRDRFRTHIRAARAATRPLVIHTRAAADDTLAILREMGEDGSSGSAGGVFHCFTEDMAVARAALDLGFYLSFSGIVTFKNAAHLREIAAWMPADRILIETDSPYLAPVPHRGKTNTPAYVPLVAACIAELRGWSIEQAAEQTSANFDRLFPIAAAPASPH